MSGEIVAFVSVLVWLGLGGWSFRTLGEKEPTAHIVGLFVFCILLAPFTAGVAIAETHINRRAAQKKAKP